MEEEENIGLKNSDINYFNGTGSVVSQQMYSNVRQTIGTSKWNNLGEINQI